MIQYGIDHISEYRKMLNTARVALLTNITGRDSALRADIQILQEICHLTALFGPEHGVRGNIGAGELVDQYTDPVTGLPVYSLYGKAGRHFTQEMLECFDLLIYDIQDVGVRFFTYLSTLRNALADCAAAGKTLLVLDRPNPLGGEIVEGGMVQEGYYSFVGCCRFPYRYGLTAGEAAVMLNEEEKLGCDLQVAKCTGWKRTMQYPEWNKIWIAPSPALMNFESVLCYPGTCLLEGTNISVGRGTAAPFRVVGAEFIDAEELAEVLNRAGLPGVVATPVWFTPSTSKYEGKNCGGVTFHVTDREKFRPVTLGITLLDHLRHRYGQKFRVLPPSAEGKKPMLSLLSGSGDLLGEWERYSLLAAYEAECQEFILKKQQYHLYE